MRTLNALLVVLMLALGGGAAVAGPLEDAKAAGLVGERPDGYVAAVSSNPPPDIVALVNDINARRRAAYTEIATKNGTSVEAVGAVAAERLYREAAAGTYLMVDGRWVRK